MLNVLSLCLLQRSVAPVGEARCRCASEFELRVATLECEVRDGSARSGAEPQGFVPR